MFIINRKGSMVSIDKIKIQILRIVILSMCFLQTGCTPQAVMNADGDWRVLPKSEISKKIKEKQALIPGYQRLLTSTYLTYPEWYIVYNSQEYADYLKKQRPSAFPYFASISQYWWGYRAVNKVIRQDYPADAGDHLMLAVIGSSYSLEYVIKGVYENSIGRFTEWLSANEATAEDRYAQKIAADYAHFIQVDPWFDYRYGKALTGVWTKTGFVGSHMVRKIERKLFLSMEYSVKAAYAALVGIGSHLTYGSFDPHTYALVTNVPNGMFKKQQLVKRVKSLGAKSALISLPSEQPFTEAVATMINSGTVFKDIAGNNEILVTAITPKNWVFRNNNAQLLFTIGILTKPSLQRIAIRVPTGSLLLVLSYLKKNKAVIEHVYAY